MTVSSETEMARADLQEALVELASSRHARDELMEAQLIGRGTTPEQTVDRLLIVMNVLQRAGIQINNGTGE